MSKNLSSQLNQIKNILFVLFLFSFAYSQNGIRTLNSSLNYSQRLVTAIDDTASYFRWGMSNGTHTLYIPYNLSPTIDTGGISNLNGLNQSTQLFAVDTTINTSPAFSSSVATHTFRFPMSRINNKLNYSDTTTQRAYSDAKYGILANANTWTGVNTFTRIIHADSLIADNGNLVVNDSLKVVGTVSIIGGSLGGTINGQLFLSTTMSNGVDKNAKIVVPLYDSTKKNLLLIQGYNPVTRNEIAIGGNSSAQNSATVVGIFVGDSMNHAEGNRVFVVDSTRNTAIGTSATVSTNRLTLKNGLKQYLFGMYNSRNTFGSYFDSSFNYYTSGSIGVGTSTLTDKINSSGGIRTTGATAGGTGAYTAFYYSSGSVIITQGSSGGVGGRGMFSVFSRDANGSNSHLPLSIATTGITSLIALTLNNNATNPYISTLYNSRSILGAYTDSSFNTFNAGYASTTGKVTAGDTIRSGNYTTYSYFIPGGALVQSSDSTTKENIQPFSANLANFKLVQPRTYNFKKETFIIPFDEKSVPDSIRIEIDSATSKMVSNKSTKDLIRAEHIQKNDAVAERLASVNHAGFLAQEFNQKLFNKSSNEIRQEDLINAMWAKIQELELRLEKVEKK